MRINSPYLVEIGALFFFSIQYSILFKIRKISVLSLFARSTPRITGGYQNC